MIGHAIRRTYEQRLLLYIHRNQNNEWFDFEDLLGGGAKFEL